MGVCHFPSFREAMAATQHIVKLDPAAVELVDRTMIDLARQIDIFRPTIERFVRGEPAALLLVEFAGEGADEQLRKLAQPMLKNNYGQYLVSVLDEMLL
jgi:hypothetical protein